MNSSIHLEPHSELLLATTALIVSEHPEVRQRLREHMLSLPWRCLEAQSGAEALEVLQQEDGSDVLLMEAALPDLLFEEFRSLIRERFPQTEMLTVNMQGDLLHFDPPSASPYAIQLSAIRPTGKRMVAPSLGGAYLDETRDTSGMVGDSLPMRNAYTLIHMVAKRPTTVLVTGESGTGKDLVAQAVHALSDRRKQPFVVVNCAALPESLLEAELFGYSKGAFTGAMQSRMGRIHAAHGGTLFLDEIGDMPVLLQSKLLRFLEQGEVQRLGSNDNLKVDVRVIAATNGNLKDMVAQKLFREDLLYRLAVFLIDLPPLRERLEDIPKLAKKFMDKFSPGVSLEANALARLYTHRWPGNVRELRNVMERASIMMGQEREIRAEHIIF